MKQKNYKLDNLDMRILNRLLNNCRESDRHIGKAIGVSGGTVKSRIQKMINDGIIEYFTLKIEPPVLGYSVFYIVVTGRDSADILKQVSLVGDPFFVVTCVGGITVCGIVASDNVQQKIELATNLMKDVKVLSIFKAENHRVYKDLTKTDLEIIEKLMNNPRETIDKLSKETNLSTKTITRSIEKLQKDEAIQFTLVYEPTKMEGYIAYAILTWISDNMEETLEELKSNFSEHFLENPFLTKNQIVLFMYSNNIFKIDDLVQKVRDTSGIKSTDLFIPKKILFPQKWIIDAIKKSQKLPTLHLMYQTH